MARLVRGGWVGVLGLALGCSGLALGCSGLEDESCDYDTAEISAVALVIDSGFDIRATIDFELGDRRGRGTPLHLCDSDQLTINGREPTRIDKASRVEYSLSLDADAERSFEFVLDRQAQDEQRIAFGVELPPAFEILTPMDGDDISLDQPPLVEWEPALDEQSTLLVRLGEALGEGQCLTAPMGEPSPYEQRGGVPVPDTGQWQLDAADLESPSPVPCDLTYTLTRLTLGDYPAAFERGGRIEARVERYRDVTVQP